MTQVGKRSRGVRCLWAFMLGVLGTCAVFMVEAPGVEAADERAPSARSDEINQIEQRMEELETQLDAIYEQLTEYTVNSAPQEILDERQRIEQDLQALHAQRTQLLSDASRDAPTARRSFDPPSPPREPQRRKPLANSIVKIGSNLVVRSDEIVNGDAIIMGGNVRIEGEVLGDVVVLGGDLEITRTARIGGQALAVGGYLDTADDAIIEGGDFGLSFFPARGGLVSGWSRGMTLMFDAVQFLLLLGMATWFLLIHGRRFNTAHEYLEGNGARSFGLGVLVLSAGSFVVSVFAMLLLATLVGVPVALLMGVVAGVVLLAALFLGSLQLGREIQKTFRVTPGSRVLSVGLGLLLVLLPEVLGDALAVFSPWIDLALDVVSGILTVLVLSLGLGALVMTRLGRTSLAPDLGESPTLPIPVAG